MRLKLYIYDYLGAHLTLCRFLFFAFLIFSYGCGSNSDYSFVDFSKTVTVELPQRQNVHEATLRVAVAAMVSPKETFAYYRDLLNYIGSKLNHHVQLIQRKTYGEIDELLQRGTIDIAFICTGPYAIGREKYGFEALATPIVRGKPFYQSYLIVNKDSTFQKLDDLRGHIFAFTDPESNTGFLVPKYWLLEMGEKPESFFKSFNFTYSHDNSILAVSRSLVNGATVDSLIWEYYHDLNPVHTSNTRIIKKSQDFGSPPLVASSHVPSNLKTQIQELIYSMHRTPEGNGILNELMIDRFIPPQEKWYDSVRHMKHRLQRLEKTANAIEKS